MAMSRNRSIALLVKFVASTLAALILATSGSVASAGPGGGGGGGGGSTGGTGVANPKLIAVVSLSQHRALATYDRDLDAASLQASSYVINSTQAVNLPVISVSRATNNQVFINTGPQEPVTYVMKKPKTSRPVTFTGSMVVEPALQSATAVSSTQIVLLFSQPMGAGADNPANYTINVAGSTQTLAVLDADVTGNQVILTTAPQGPVSYELRIGDIQSESGIYINPTSSSTSFPGSTVPAGPRLLSAEPQGESGVLLTFDTALAASATEPTRYTITPTIAVSGATQLSGGTQVMLATGTLFEGAYTVVVDVVGATGSAVNANFDSATFEGSVTRPPDPEPDVTRPMVASAGSANNVTVVVQFSEAMADDAIDTSHYAIVQENVNPEVGALPVIAAAFVDDSRQSVRLTTRSQNEVTYKVTANNVTDLAGNPLASRFFSGGVLIDPTSFVFPGTPPSGAELVNADCGRTATLLGVERSGDSSLILTFDTVLDGDAASDVANYALTGAGTAVVDDASVMTGGSKVQLTADRPLATGAGATATAAVVSYCDTLYDHEEYLGWPVTITLATGGTIAQQVTSNPDIVDTDGDQLTDDVERSLGIDPRDADTDDDGLADYPEFNEYYTDPTNQDTDGDSLYDGLETTFFLTSPIFDDTDGDQLKDAAEISVNRNPRVSDLPAPVLQIGETSLKLDVRFTESDGESTRELDSELVETTLTQSESQEFSRSEESTHEVSALLAEGFGVSVTAGCGGFLCSSPSVSATFDYNRSTEQTDTTSWTSTFSDTSAQETQQEYRNSLTTEAEVSTDSTVTRTVNGAEMNVGVILESAGDVAFTVRNLEVTALIADPDDPSRLTPVATLLPADPAVTFNLGPLVPAKGPILFTNTDIFPQVVEDLMRDPRGLVFRFSNYDITDEAGRNFAYTSQEVNDRTARVAIDYGGFDPDGDGLGESSEILRVATGVIGRRIVDTDADGDIDDDDRAVVFDTSGNQAGISLRDALGAAGLTEYDEAETPSGSLSFADRQNSYSVLKSPDGTTERLFRVRGRQIQPGTSKSWEILTATGIDRSVTLDEHILLPGESVTLSFLEDADQDEMPASLEAMHRCSDSEIDSDGDLLDDRFEVMIGWDLQVQGRSARNVRSSCQTSDTDGDGRLDFHEAPGGLSFNDDGRVLYDRGVDPWIAANAPRRNESGTPDPLLGWELTDPITDPTRIDTDADMLTDAFELTPYQNALGPPHPAGTLSPLQATSPERSDSDDDGVSDGLERSLGGNPRVDDLVNLTDTDRDGLADGLEAAAYPVSIRGAHERTAIREDVCNSACPDQPVTTVPGGVTSEPGLADTDDDGLGDAEERDLGLHPGAGDTDADGLTDFEEVRGLELRDLGVIRTDPLNVDTDNDKRTDGEEAGRRGGPWVVRVLRPNTPPREVFSHPLRSDTDLDRLLDGDEQSFLADPTNYNTDGDPRHDITEVERETRTNVPDLNVELQFGSLSIIQTGEGDNNDAAEVNWLIDANGPSMHIGYGGVGHSAKAPGSIAMDSDIIGLGSVSTSDAVPEQIWLTGFISERDDGTNDCSVDLATFALPDGDQPAILAGSALTPGIRNWPLHRVATCKSGHVFEFTLNVAIRAT